MTTLPTTSAVDALRAAVQALPAADRPTFHAVGSLDSAPSHPKTAGKGLYVIVFNTPAGMRLYHGMADVLSSRLMQHRTAARRLGFRVGDRRVLVAPMASRTLADVRRIEERINTFLLARHRALVTNLRAEFELAPLHEESTMHPMTCGCARCRNQGELEVLGFEGDAGEFESADESAYEFEGAMDDAREVELALELLSVSSEEELDQFLGKLVSGAWKGLKKVGSAVGKIAKPLGGVLRSVAKTALPFVGGALGSFIPIPGVGTMIGRAVGQAVSSALEAETAGLDPDARDLEMARRFVRIADTAARQAASAVTRGVEPVRAVQQAVASAARQQVPGMAAMQGQGAVARSAARAGLAGARARRWVRRGNTIVVHGV